MKKQTLFDLASMPKMVLVITLVVMLGALFGATSYLVRIPKIDLPIVNPVIEDQCEIDSDCMLTYVDDYVCLPCDTSLEDYKCLNIDEAKEIKNKRDKRDESHPVLCTPCFDKFDKYICECENGKCEKVKEELAMEVSITTDKMEYERGEMVKITVENNLDDPIKHLKGVGCGLQGFSNGEWVNVSSRSCMWEGESKLKPNSEYNFNWTSSRWGLEKYRIAFHYEEQEVLDTGKKIGKILCENIPNELEELLLNGKWIKNDVKPCITCHACGCSCTVKDVWSINEASIDVAYVSCGGSGYTIKYKGEEYNCVPENYKPLYEQASIYPQVPEGWETIYSNEFTIKEKSALDARCGEKVKIIGDCPAYFEEGGYEFDSETEKCIERFIKGSGCGVINPFYTLEECQEICEKSENCADNNDLVYAFHIKPTKPSTCCDDEAGIRPLRQLLPNGLCQTDVPLDGAIGRCILKDKKSYIWGACGNGICDEDENKCNCPEDCE